VAPIVETEKTYYGQDGRDAILDCKVSVAIPKATIRWKISGTQIFLDEINNSKFKIINNFDISNEYESKSRLIIKNISKKEKQKFTCVAINKVAVSQQELNLIIEYKPELMYDKNEKYFSWLLDNEPTSYSLNSNGVSYSENTFLPVEFVCLTEGEPVPLITWYFKNQKIKIDNYKYKLLKNEPNYSKLEVNPKGLDDFGEFTCVSENKYGQVEKYFNLKYLSKPNFTPSINEKIIKADSLIVEIKQDFKENIKDDSEQDIPVDGYQIQWIQIDSTKPDWTKPNEIIFSLKENDLNQPTIYTEINNLLPDTQYIFRSAAINKAGVSDFISNEIKIRTKLKPTTRLILISVLFLSLFVFFVFVSALYFLIASIEKTYKARPKYEKLVVRV
jgi:hypothetical protein